MSLTQSISRALTDPGMTRRLTDPGAGGGVFSPLNYFDGTKQGGLYDLSGMSTIAQDTAGSTPSVVPTDPIAYMADASGNANTLIQATGANALLLRFDADGVPYADTATGRCLYSSTAFDLSASNKVTVVAWYQSTAVNTGMVAELPQLPFQIMARSTFRRQTRAGKASGSWCAARRIAHYKGREVTRTCWASRDSLATFQRRVMLRRFQHTSSTGKRRAWPPWLGLVLRAAGTSRQHKNSTSARVRQTRQNRCRSTARFTGYSSMADRLPGRRYGKLPYGGCADMASASPHPLVIALSRPIAEQPQ